MLYKGQSRILGSERPGFESLISPTSLFPSFFCVWEGPYKKEQQKPY